MTFLDHRVNIGHSGHVFVGRSRIKEEFYWRVWVM